MGELPDITDRADCERLVRTFYGRALTDPVIGFITLVGGLMLLALAWLQDRATRPTLMPSFLRHVIGSRPRSECSTSTNGALESPTPIST